MRGRKKNASDFIIWLFVMFFTTASLAQSTLPFSKNLPLKTNLDIQPKAGTALAPTRAVASKKRVVPLMPEPSLRDLLEDSEAEGGHRE